MHQNYGPGFKKSNQHKTHFVLKNKDKKRIEFFSNRDIRSLNPAVLRLKAGTFHITHSTTHIGTRYNIKETHPDTPTGLDCFYIHDDFALKSKGVTPYFTYMGINIYKCGVYGSGSKMLIVDGWGNGCFETESVIIKEGDGYKRTYSPELANAHFGDLLPASEGLTPARVVKFVLGVKSTTKRLISQLKKKDLDLFGVMLVLADRPLMTEKLDAVLDLLEVDDEFRRKTFGNYLFLRNLI